MIKDDADTTRSREGSDRPDAVYEAPRIVWREPYEPVSFGISCAKQPGNPGCGPGPYKG